MSDTNTQGNEETEQSVARRVIDVVAEHADVPFERVGRETRIFDLTDSLGAVEIVMALEDEFEGSIPDEVSDTIQTVGQLIDHVETHLASASTGP